MNIPLIIIGVIEQIIVFTIILPSTGWWFAIFGIAAVWEIFTNIGNTDTGSDASEDEYYDDESYDDPSEEKSFRTSPVSDGANYETRDYDNSIASTIVDEAHIVSKPIDSSRIIPKKNNEDLLKQGFEVVKKIK